MPQTTTRRALIASVLTTTVAPKLAFATAAPADPIFAALESKSNAKIAFLGACEERKALASTLSPDVTRISPRVKYSTFWDIRTDVRGDLFLHRHDAIEDKVQSEQRRAELHAALDADAAELERAQEATGYAAKIRAVSAADEAESAASMVLTNTVPTTIAGAIAALEYHNLPFMGREPNEFLATIIRGLKALT